MRTNLSASRLQKELRQGKQNSDHLCLFIARRASLFLGLLVCCGLVGGDLKGQATLQQAVQSLVNHPALQQATVAVDVLALESGESLAAHDRQRALIPASTLKLVTTGVALRQLGAESRLATRLYAAGPIRNGVLLGNLFLVGQGDPSLGSDQIEGGLEAATLLAQWTTALQQAGIRAIEGAVIADVSYFGSAGLGSGWPWADIGNYYGTGVYGLNWHENFYYLDFVQRQTEGSRPSVLRSRPEIQGLHFQNELVVGPKGSGDQAYIYAAPFNYEAYIRGSIPAGTGVFTIKGAIPDPALFLAQQLTKSLQAAGIRIAAPASSSRFNGQAYTSGGKLLHEHFSPTIGALVERTNLRSVNLYAEALLRHINKKLGLPPADLHSTESLLTYLAQEMRLSTAGMQLQDGSGLGTRNFFSPAFLTAFLQQMADDTVFLRSIPLAGKSGSMKNRLQGTAAEGRLYAKSGSVDAVRCFAGYAITQSGKRLAFSVMVNNHTLSGTAINELLYTFMRQLCEAKG